MDKREEIIEAIKLFGSATVFNLSAKTENELVSDGYTVIRKTWGIIIK